MPGRKMEEIRWYEKLNYTETKDIIKEKLQNMSRDFVAIYQLQTTEQHLLLIIKGLIKHIQHSKR